MLSSMSPDPERTWCFFIGSFHLFLYFFVSRYPIPIAIRFMMAPTNTHVINTSKVKYVSEDILTPFTVWTYLRAASLDPPPAIRYVSRPLETMAIIMPYRLKLLAVLFASFQ